MSCPDQIAGSEGVTALTSPPKLPEKMMDSPLNKVRKHRRQEGVWAG